MKSKSVFSIESTSTDFKKLRSMTVSVETFSTCSKIVFISILCETIFSGFPAAKAINDSFRFEISVTCEHFDESSFNVFMCWSRSRGITLTTSKTSSIVSIDFMSAAAFALVPQEPQLGSGGLPSVVTW